MHLAVLSKRFLKSLEKHRMRQAVNMSRIRRRQAKPSPHSTTASVFKQYVHALSLLCHRLEGVEEQLQEFEMARAAADDIAITKKVYLQQFGTTMFLVLLESNSICTVLCYECRLRSLPQIMIIAVTLLQVVKVAANRTVLAVTKAALPDQVNP